MSVVGAKSFKIIAAAAAAAAAIVSLLRSILQKEADKEQIIFVAASTAWNLSPVRDVLICCLLSPFPNSLPLTG